MKKTAFIIFLALAFAGYAQNTLSLSSASGHPGDTVTLALSMDNSDAVTALQTFIPLHGQLQYVSGSATLSSRSNGHVVSATVLHDTLRIYSYSMGLSAYNGNSGTVLTFRVVLGKEPATYDMSLCSTVISSSSGSSLPVLSSFGSVTILAPKISLSPNSIDYGHCPIRSSYTRTVTVRNIGNQPLVLSSATFDQPTLGCSSSNVTIAAGGQQSVTITYLPVTSGTVTLHGLFHSNARVGDSLLTIAADPYSVNELRPLSVSGYTDSIVTVQLRLNNMDSIVALQSSIKLPAALTYIPGSFAVESSRSQGHLASAGLFGDTLTMLVMSTSNRPLRGGDGVVASFQLRLHGYGSHTLRLLQTVLSDTAANNVLSAVYTGSVSIYSPTITCNSTLDMGSSPVTETAEATFSVRNNGNAPLVIDHINFTAQGYSVAETMPLTVDNYQTVVLHVTYSDTVAGTFPCLMQIYNNDPRATLKQISATCHRYEPNALYMSSNPDNDLDNATVSVMLDNYSAITALQMDVEYPHQYVSMESGDLHLTSRSNGHLVTAARQNDSTLRILVLSMQNSAFNGHSGPVLDMQMHINDTNDLNQYPLQLHNVMVANASGANRITSLDSICYIATRLMWDTLYIHDTTIVVDTLEIHDTTTVIQIDTAWLTEYIHDTTIVNNYIHDTTIVTEFVHDTTYLWQYDTTIVNNYIHDTTIVNNYIHDTTIVNNYIHDTTYLWQYDTTIVNNYIHDTTIVNNYIHDTTYLWQYDTTYINNYIHDTTIVNNYIYDTTYLWQYDTTYINNYIHDTTYLWQYDTTYIDNYIHDTTIVNNYIYDTIYLTDTLYLHDTIYIHDTITVGVNEVNMRELKVYADRGQIVVEGASESNVSLYDVNGRLLATKNDYGDKLRFDVPVSGTYLIKANGFPARKIVVIR